MIGMEEAKFAEIIRQVHERAAAMATKGDGSKFGENIHYPSSPEEFGQPLDDAAIWDDEIGFGTSSDFIEETEEQNLWGLNGGRIYGSAAGGLHGGVVGGRGGPAGGRRGLAGGRGAGGRVHNSQVAIPEIGPGRRGRGRQASRRGASYKAGRRGTGRKTGRRGAGHEAGRRGAGRECGRRGAGQGGVDQGGRRTEAAGGACQDRRGVGRREEAGKRLLSEGKRLLGDGKRVLGEGKSVLGSVEGGRSTMHILEGGSLCV
jgi:hypothetical protein